MKFLTACTILAFAMPAFADAQQPTPPATQLPASPTPARPPAGKVKAPAEFAADATSGNLFAKRLASVAMKRGRQGEIRSLAARMLREENKAQGELNAAIKDQHVKVRANLTPSQARKLQALRTAPANQFDNVFLSAEMDAAQKQMKRLSLYGDKGAAGPLKHYARTHYPLARMRFLQARALSGR